MTTVEATSAGAEPDHREPEDAARPPGGWKWWLAVFGAWTLFAVWSTNQYLLLGMSMGRQTEPWLNPLRIYLVSSWFWALVATPAVVLLARRFPIARHRMLHLVGIHLGAFAFLHCAHVGLNTLAYPVITGNAMRAYVPQLFSQANINIFSYLVVLTIIQALTYHRAFQERHLRAAQLETLLAQARLDALRAQLHPHFLFNTLHAITALMHRDTAAAERMLSQLSDLLRMALEGADLQEVSLVREMEFLTRYLEIERTRFEDRLRIVVDVEPKVLDARVPHLVLQPLAENAVRHGIAPRARGGTIEVRARRDGERLLLTVADDGVGMNGRAGRFREGIGLANTRKRLHELYGESHRLALENRIGGGLAVTLSIPFRKVSGSGSTS